MTAVCLKKVSKVQNPDKSFYFQTLDCTGNTGDPVVNRRKLLLFFQKVKIKEHECVQLSHGVVQSVRSLIVYQSRDSYFRMKAADVVPAGYS